MVRRAAIPGAVATAVALLAGAVAGGMGTGFSAALGVAVVVANFAANGLALAWAAEVSPVAYQVAALGGFLLRLGVILALLFGLSVFTWFSPVAFGFAAIPAAVLLLAFEARLWLGGLGQELILPAGNLPGAGGDQP